MTVLFTCCSVVDAVFLATKNQLTAQFDATSMAKSNVLPITEHMLLQKFRQCCKHFMGTVCVLLLFLVNIHHKLGRGSQHVPVASGVERAVTTRRASSWRETLPEMVSPCCASSRNGPPSILSVMPAQPHTGAMLLPWHPSNKTSTSKLLAQLPCKDSNDSAGRLQHLALDPCPLQQ